MNRVLNYVRDMSGGRAFWSFFTVLFAGLAVLNAITAMDRGGWGNWIWVYLMGAYTLITGFIAVVKLRAAKDD